MCQQKSPGTDDSYWMSYAHNTLAICTRCNQRAGKHYGPEPWGQDPGPWPLFCEVTRGEQRRFVCPSDDSQEIACPVLTGSVGHSNDLVLVNDRAMCRAHAVRTYPIQLAERTLRMLRLR